MMIAAGTVAINPAFLEEIKNDHRELWSLLKRIRGCCAALETASASLDEFIGLLYELRDALGMHFALEEAYGYFDDAIDVAPHIADNAERLRNQHRVLYGEINDLAEVAEELQFAQVATSAIRELVEGFERFDAKLTAHEADERRLLMSAYLDDIGVGD